MRRQKEDMQVNVAGLRRNIKNLAHNYSDAQVKVREATSNDPWGPSSTLMSEIADLTYNVVAFTEIMQMVWKRLNDHGRNWRHVYKALVLLEYLIKTGTEKVAQQCKENIFAIQTLKDFQYFEESKDQGLNVREKAKQLVSLLKDDERLRNERARALKAKERFAQAASGFGSEGMDTVSPSSPSFPAGFQGSWSSCEVEPTSRELETARPQTVGEEELQLQLALAMSREEAEQEEQRRRSDDVRLQLALSQSEEEFNRYHHSQGKASSEKQSHMLDLLDVNLGNHSTHPPHAAALDPWGFPQPVPQSPPTRPQNDPWSSPASSVPSASTIASPTPAVDPWTPVPSSAVELVHHKPPAVVDPWRAVSPQPPARPALPANDPWSPSTNTDHSSPGTASPRAGLSSPSGGDLDEFDVITNRERPALNSSQVNNVNSLNNNGGTVSPDPFDMSLLGDSLENKQQQKRTPHSFLGENSALVNLDNLVTVSKPPSVAPSPVPQALSMGTANPFAGVAPSPPNLFQQQQQIRPSINQIRQQPFVGNVQAQGSTESAWGPAPTHRPVLPNPLLPSAQPNPFLS
ncbi:Epsin-2 [Cryptotermes secundus]|uniref:Epsin-2 n=1 Tax=Cryptotermes secundus TaxID=105785 RepID=A0A2J7QAH3_9NEOP|nr:epsin-2 isoform X1 [Cryptotermes secundus]XP_023715476.1 epsin-2 isoform X1 [Cryptotermes secundus]PNF25590.1 Epsin-2 [Cryptotermes secundus]PNF25591.1 Epsin-2 [Cryptotermes secundus]